MLIDLLYTIAGFGLLVWGADRFVAGASATAQILGVPPILIGLTIVGFATSMPEVMVSISAASNGLTGMAVGNAIGSNIANIGLVLGVAALINPIKEELSGTLRTETPLLLLITVVTAALFLDNELGRVDGFLLLGGLVVFMAWITRSGMRLKPDDPLAKEATGDLPEPMSKKKAAILVLIGFAILMAGAELLVTGAESLARRFGISDLVIGLTIVAIGTSLPELVVSVVSAFRGNSEIAIGNVIGSNVFNLLAVIGFAGAIGPGALDSSVLLVHSPIMLAFTLIPLRLAYNPFGRPGLGRGAALALIVAFVAYQILLLSGGL